MQRILVAIDLRGAREVVDFAASLAKSAGASVTLLHVVESATLLSGIVPGAHRGADSASAASASQRVLGEVSERLASEGLNVSALTREGSIVRVILEEAERGRFDLIVMGLHGRTGLGRILYGSATEAVVGRAPCPVTVVRPTP